jgi:hypothetical protein
LYLNLEQMLFGKSSSEIPHLAKTWQSLFLIGWNFRNSEESVNHNKI